MPNENESTGLIEVVRIPRGDFPIWARAAWVNLRLPCLPFMAFPEKRKDTFVGKPAQMCVWVKTEDAIKALKDVDNQEALAFWEANAPAGKYLLFREDEVKIIVGVTRQKVQHYLGVLELGCGAYDGQLDDYKD